MKNFAKYIFLLIIILFHSISIAQNSTIDSVRVLVKNAKYIENKLKELTSNENAI